MLTVIEFLKSHIITTEFGQMTIYLAGDIAGFPRELCDRLIAKNVARLHGDGRPKNPDGSPVVQRSAMARARAMFIEVAEKVTG